MFKPSKQLVTKLGISNLRYATLNKLYKQLSKLFKLAERNPTPNLAARVTRIEFALQRNWNFPTNSDFHSYQQQLPHCSCPKNDNKELFGTPHRIVNQSCIYHGGTHVHT